MAVHKGQVTILRFPMGKKKSNVAHGDLTSPQGRGAFVKAAREAAKRERDKDVARSDF